VKDIRTLIPDIYNLFNSDHRFDEKNVKEFTEHLAQKLLGKLSEARGKPALRMSNLGTPCTRKLWYSIKHPDLAQRLPAPAHIKFLFGDILESLLLWLAKEAGHTVEGEQTELEINGVKGHRDAVIDGVLVDTKSASNRSFDKFVDHLELQDDSFGYITQLGAYLSASTGDPLVVDKDIAAFFVVNKEKGELTLDIQPATGVDYHRKVDEIRGLLERDIPPERPYRDLKEGESGNRRLGPVCSYCDFKHTCWPGLRTFLYSKGPTHLTRVEREPQLKIHEVDRHGNIVERYNDQRFIN
jgi:hypothetical protein